VIFGDQTYVQKLSFPDGSIEINSGDGDPIFGYTVKVRFKDGNLLEGDLGYSGAELRHQVISSGKSPVIGLVEKGRPNQVVMLLHPITREFWALGVRHKEDWEISGTGKKLLDELRKSLREELELATSESR
jgi:hypothetical protein